jgi:signal transduction histidine kinase
MKKRNLTGSGISLAVMAAAMAALVTVAWLQYSWIGRVSEAEHHRMRARLGAAVSGFSRQFDEEVGHAMAALATGPSLTGEELREAAAHCALWKESGTEGRLVKDVYAIRWHEDKDMELLRCDPAAGRFVPVPWPGNFDRLRTRLDARRHGDFPAVPGGAVLDSQIPAIVAPRERGPWSGRMGDQRRGAAVGVMVVVLDVDFLQRELLPDLVGKFFPRSGELDYEVQVSSAAEPGKVIYQSDPTLSAGFFARPDAKGTLLGNRVGGGLRRGGPEGRENGQAGRWVVLVRNRSGSLEAVVAQARLRNLSLSFAILLLMGSAMGVLVVFSRRAQQLAERQLEFVAGVSHELRTPLTVICSAGDNLADGLVGTEKQARRYGTLIRGEGHRLARMVEQILGFAGIQSGRARYEFEPVDVNTLIDRAVAACENEIRAAGCEVETSLAPELPPVLADSVALTHCLRNLLENAAVHGKSGGWIGVRAAAVNGKVEIRVEDRGGGIDTADLPHLFDPFYRGRRALKDQCRGFGLGLALVKHIVEAHSGEIEAHSGPGTGTSFVLRIPAAKVPEEDHGGAQDPVS